MLRTRYIIYAIMVLLALSFLSYFSQAVQIGGFVFFTLICLILGLWKREYALYLVFLELTLGSFGYLLSLPLGGLNLSLRYAFFVIVTGIWLGDIIKSLPTSPRFRGAGPTSLFQREEMAIPPFVKGDEGGF